MDKERLLLPYFATHVVEHCNLNCCGCDHCAPLAEEKFADVSVFEKDFRRMSELFDTIFQVGLMGGEPLLHPDLISFFEVSRKCLPKSIIGLYTNGILLPAQKDIFWENCRKYRITIFVTKYPIDVNYKLAENKAQQFGVQLVYVDETNIKPRTFYKHVFTLDGSNNPEISYKNCFHPKIACYFLADGKFYPCTIIRNSQNFSKYFQKELTITDKDYIDIHSAKSGLEILDFIKKPIPFCRYCNTLARTYNQPWKLSKKEITEWT